jgi:hypothetical protein
VIKSFLGYFIVFRVTLALRIFTSIRIVPVLSFVRITSVIVVSLMLVGLSELRYYYNRVFEVLLLS